MDDAPATASQRLRVLLVDDDPLVLRAYVRSLAARFDVVLAASAAEALSLLGRDRAFDAVISDLMMPGMTGMELYRRAAASWPEIATRFSFVTGGACSDEAADFVATVGRPAIEKPVSADRLVSLVRHTATRS